jgi:hypothetical protein
MLLLGAEIDTVIESAAAEARLASVAGAACSVKE